MKILALHGANLASLSGEFQLSFTTAPLNGAGLFAITGETGSGKSTILDALCLALYGEYPRLAFSNAESTEDSGGELLKTNDSRHILRHGAGWAFAEVQFEAIDGLPYLARWEVRRAKDKPSGKLQPNRVSITRLTDGVTLASKVKEVQQKVGELTGLNFDQFRRTCLLAQGQFDAFLTAKANERADLLERITGTEVYSRISALVYERTDERRAKVAQLQYQLDQFSVLSPDHRKEIEAQLGDLSERAAIAKAEIERIQTELSCWLAQDAARNSLRLAQQREAAAKAAIESRAVDQILLEQLDLVEQVRPAAVQLSLSEKGQAQAAADLASAQTALAEKDRSLQMAQELHAEQTRMKEARDQSVVEWTPQWKAAEALDVSVQHAQDGAQSAQDDLLQRNQQYQDLSKIEKERTEARDSIRDGLKNLKEWLAERVSQGPMAVQIVHAEALFEARKKLRQEVAANVQERPGLLQRIGDLKNGIHSSQAEIESVGLELSQRIEAMANCAACFEAIPQMALEEQRRQIDVLVGWLEKARSICEAVIVQQEHRESHEKAATAAMVAFEHHTRALIDLGLQIAESKGALAEANRASERAQQSASQKAESLRLGLVPGEPCAVCGSINHPFIDAHPDLARLAAEAEARKAEIGTAHEALIDQQQDSSVKQANARNLAEFHNERAEAAIAQLAERGAQFNGLILHLPADVPGNPGAVALATIRDWHTTKSAEIKEINAQLEAFSAAKAQHSQLLSEQLSLEQTKTKLTQELEKKRGQADLLADNLTKAEAEKASLDTQLEASKTYLEPMLKPFTLSVDGFDAKPDATIKSFRSAAHLYLKQRDDAEKAKDAVTAAESLLSTAKANAESALNALQDVQKVALAKQNTLTEFKARRDAVLGGESVIAHRQRYLANQSAANTAHLAASTDLSAANASRSAAFEQLENCRVASARKQSEMESASNSFASACGAVGIAQARVQDLLGVSAAVRQSIQQELATLNKESHTAQQIRLEAERSLEVAVAKCEWLAGAPELENSRTSAEVTRTESLQQIGAARAKLKTDDEQQAEATKLRTEKEKENEQLQIWQEVNAAIGSKQGDKFRKFVQSLTLDHLVHLANHHLATFSPRYRLSRAASEDLTLQIIDREMADAIRPVSTLSGGERFLTSLGLALALSGLEGKDAFVDTLFIDEGFGSLDAESLAQVMAALEALPSSGRRVGVITHVAAMMDQIAVQVRVRKMGNGRSSITVIDSTVDNAILFAMHA